MNTQLSQVIDSMGLASAVVRTHTVDNTTLGARAISADYFSRQTFSQWTPSLCKVLDESVHWDPQSRSQEAVCEEPCGVHQRDSAPLCIGFLRSRVGPKRRSRQRFV